MDLDSKRTESKRTYEPPQLTTISLRPEEAVLGACKVFGHSGGGISQLCGLGCPNAGS